MSDTDDFKQVSSLLNFAHPTNWILEIPIKSVGLGTLLEDMGYKSSTFAMNVTSFTLGRMTLEQTDVTYQSYTMSYPSGSEDTEKEFTVNYTLSSTYQQYYFLTRWWQKNLNVLKHIEEDDADNNGESYLSTVSIWALDDFKKPCMKIEYYDSWLKELGELQLSYKESEGLLEHSFTCRYNNYLVKLL